MERAVVVVAARVVEVEAKAVQGAPNPNPRRRAEVQGAPVGPAMRGDTRILSSLEVGLVSSVETKRREHSFTLFKSAD